MGSHVRSEGNAATIHSVWLYLGVGFVTCAALIMQITATKVFSFAFWHHFAYIIISIALLGFGVAGTYLAIHKRRAVEPSHLSRYCIGIAISALVSYLLVTRIEFRPLEVFQNRKEWVPLAFIWVATAVPFFFTGLTVATVLSSFPKKVNRIYFADLVGAAIGAGIVLALLGVWGATGNIVFSAVLAALAAVFFAVSIGKRPSLSSISVLLILLAVLIRILSNPVELWPIRPSKGKDMHWRSDQTMSFSKWNAVARIDVTEPFQMEPSFSGNISAAFLDTTYEAMALYQDAAAATPMYRVVGDLKEELPFLGSTNQSAAYRLFESPRVLVIGPGGGIDVLISLYFEPALIEAVEINPVIVDVTGEQFSDYIGDIYLDPRVTLHNAEGRAFLRKSAATYDIIQLSGVDTFAALSSGAYALSESYLYTVEAMEDLLDHLSAEGVVSFSRWIFDPPRETLRLCRIMKAALRRSGALEPYRHMCVIRGPHWATTLMKRGQFSSSDLAVLRGFAQDNGFDIVFDPAGSGETPFDTLLRSTFSDEMRFAQGYPYDIGITTDDSPFFFQWFRWTSVFSSVRESGTGGYHITRMPIANVMLLLGLGLVSVLSVFLVLAPLRNLPRVSSRLAFLSYFALIGLGFMFVEIVTMQKFVLLLGHPSYSISVTLLSMLAFSGLGSLWSRRWAANPRRLLVVSIPLLTCLIVIGNAMWPYLIEQLHTLSFSIRVLASVTLIAPMALLMGVPFPTGLGFVHRAAGELMPWAWGVNALCSVLGSILATLLAMWLGFSGVLLIAGGLYFAALLVSYTSFAQDS